MSDIPPKHSNELKVSFPAEHVIVLTMNRPKTLNSMSRQLENDIRVILNWFDDSPNLWYVCPVSILLHSTAVFLLHSTQGLPLLPEKERHSVPGLISKSTCAA